MTRNFWLSQLKWKSVEPVVFSRTCKMSLIVGTYSLLQILFALSKKYLGKKRIDLQAFRILFHPLLWTLNKRAYQNKRVFIALKIRNYGGKCFYLLLEKVCWIISKKSSFIRGFRRGVIPPIYLYLVLEICISRNWSLNLILKLNFLSISNLIFTACVACKNQIQIK